MDATHVATAGVQPGTPEHALEVLTVARDHFRVSAALRQLQASPFSDPSLVSYYRGWRDGLARRLVELGVG